MSARTDAVAGDGTLLLTRSWSARGEPWAVVLLVHGLSEHSGRYEHVGEWLSEAGLEVRAYDQRGFGASGGRRGDVRTWRLLLDDLEARLGAARRPGLPLVLYGHSMGGLLCTEYAESRRPQPDLLVLSSPGLDSGHPRLSAGRPRCSAACCRGSASQAATTSRSCRATRRWGRHSATIHWWSGA